MADPNTRQGKRTPVTLKIKFKSETLEQFIERYAVDVSQGGIFIRTKEPLAVGTQMRFEFQLRDASPLIGGEGTVVWTRENDPSRPAIAPGMGVRFDRLADGSQAVLERILAEKAKQAPSRTATESTKPPLFTDTPTRVAPAPVQDALLGKREPEHTPLPKPMPFHSDAEDFPEEAFEEATKVRALDDLIAQTAEGQAAPAGEPAPATPGADDLAARRAGLHADSTLPDPPAPAPHVPDTLDPSSTSPGFASGRPSDRAIFDKAGRDSAPNLPSPPEVARPRMLDTSPSPRSDSDAMEAFAKTKLGMEPVPARVASTPAPPPTALRDPPAPPSGMPAVPSEPTASVRMPAKKSAAPIIILLLVLLAAAGAGVWFFVLRDKAVEDNQPLAKPTTGSGSAPAGSGSAAAGLGSGSAGSGTAATPAAPLVAIQITAATPKANIEIVGTPHAGPAPLEAKLEKDKQYTVRVSAPGFATLEREVTGGQDKLAIEALAPKPRVISVTSEPASALIYVDGVPTGKATPQDIELTAKQAAAKRVKISLRKVGFRALDRNVVPGDFTEEDTRMVVKLSEKLLVYNPVVRPPGGGTGSAGSAGSGSGEGGGSAPPPDGSGSADQPPPPPPPPSGGGGSASEQEPTPEFVKP